jgi:uncharacterized protein (DUF58 family)
MSVKLDHAMVERAAVGCVLRLPRVPHRGKLGEVRASSVGSSLELHDFRQYSPGDDLRHIDWNAVARTGELYLRVRQDEVSPRVEVLIDGSASMAVSDAKAARAREVAAWVCTLARRGGLDPVLIATGVNVQKGAGPVIRALLDNLSFDGREPFDLALRRAPPLATCGLRVVISDFLFESPPEPFAERLARGAAGLMLVQVLDEARTHPHAGGHRRLSRAAQGPREPVAGRRPARAGHVGAGECGVPARCARASRAQRARGGRMNAHVLPLPSRGRGSGRGVSVSPRKMVTA